MEKVKIYVLIDPITLKVKYIGRTKIKNLNTRLSQHITKAKYYKDNTHKSNWIRSLLKINSRPYIKKIATVEGWKESYIFEKNLINKYKSRLVNHNDRGEGGLNTIVTVEQRKKISNTLKNYYKIHQIKTVTEIHVYNYDGSHYNSYISIKAASEDLGIYHGTISKHLCGISKIPNRIKKQFSYSKVDKMIDYTKN
jgi:hypothetical protein